jgi:lysophospholipase L1-like esterase
VREGPKSSARQAAGTADQDDGRPEAVVTVTPELGDAPLGVWLDGRRSSTGRGIITEYDWHFADGSNPRQGSHLRHVFHEPGNHRVRLTVTTDHGLSASTEATVTVRLPSTAGRSSPRTEGAQPAPAPLDQVRDGAPPPSRSRAPNGSESRRSFRDTFSADSLDRYAIESVGIGNGTVQYDTSRQRMKLSAPPGTRLRLSRAVPLLARGMLQIRFLAEQAKGPDPRFTIYLHQDPDHYYQVQCRVHGTPGSEGVTRKVVDGAAVGEAALASKYRLDTAHSINVYFSPERLTVEFPTHGSRIVSLPDATGTPILVNRITIELANQVGFISDLACYPADALPYYVAYGDSLTEGSNDTIPADGRGYPILLQDWLDITPDSLPVVFNEGIGGLRTARALDRLHAVLERHPAARFFTLMIGTNDALQGGLPSGLGTRPGQPGYAGSYKGLLQQMVDLIRAHGATPFLAKIPPVSYVVPAQRVRAYNRVIDEILADDQAGGLPGPAPDFEALFGAYPDPDWDGIHPGGYGYQNMASLWFRCITGTINGAGASTLGPHR